MTIQTTLSRGWLVRMSIVIVVGFVFAVWGVFDATVAYPRRGGEYAEHMEKVWLEVLDSGHMLTTAWQRIQDPQARLGELSGLVGTPAEEAERDWLEALAIIGKVDDALQGETSPRERLDVLRQRLQGRQQPKKLNPWDIPSQWAIVVVGGVIGLWCSFLVFKASRLTYRFDEEEGILRINDLAVPLDEMTGMDKRRWQKKSIAMLLTADGASHKLDAWVYGKLEDIIDILDTHLEGDDAEKSEADAAPEDETAPTDPDDAGDDDDVTEQE
ncbi:MAG: hypothetical protein KAS72_01860 [Phycisphaerales bacterium]|nr:hypothetical protein [Phycisphaerales bacterium]